MGGRHSSPPHCTHPHGKRGAAEGVKQGQAVAGIGQWWRSECCNRGWRGAGFKPFGLLGLTLNVGRVSMGELPSSTPRPIGSWGGGSAWPAGESGGWR
eukprot:1599223-Amphidinium_carterae.2